MCRHRKRSISFQILYFFPHFFSLSARFCLFALICLLFRMCRLIVSIQAIPINRSSFRDRSKPMAVLPVSYYHVGAQNQIESKWKDSSIWSSLFFPYGELFIEATPSESLRLFLSIYRGCFYPPLIICHCRINISLMPNDCAIIRR